MIWMIMSIEIVGNYIEGVLEENFKDTLNTITVSDLKLEQKLMKIGVF